MALLSTVEVALGWSYFVAWSATFWPQVLLIFRRRTTAGLSTDFVAINIVGFVSYCIFTFASYTVPSVTESYQRATGYPPQVELSDVLFAAHGAIMCAVIIAQLFIFPPRTPPTRYVLVGALVFQTLVLLGLFAAVAGSVDWYNYLRFAGMVKVLSSLIKHFPQVWLNRARGSTVGWSFTMVLLDFTGGFLSIAQQIVRSFSIGSAAPFTSNLAKTFLAGETLVFDLWFIIQHTIFFTDRTDIDQTAKGKDSSLKPRDDESVEAPLIPISPVT